MGNKHDDVNHPEHYTQGGIECIDYLKAKLTPEQFEGYLKGCIIKYLSRCEIKGSKIKDIEKADWYMARLLIYYRTILDEDRKICSQVHRSDREEFVRHLMVSHGFINEDAVKIVDTHTATFLCSCKDLEL